VVVLFLVVVAISAQIAHTLWRRNVEPQGISPAVEATQKPDGPTISSHERLDNPQGPRVVVRVSSSPPMATVFEGETRLGVTPIDLVRTKGTTQRIRIMKDGYLEYSAIVRFDRGRVYPVSLRHR
jgi:hypothetical protein